MSIHLPDQLYPFPTEMVVCRLAYCFVHEQCHAKMCQKIFVIVIAKGTLVSKALHANPNFGMTITNNYGAHIPMIFAHHLLHEKVMWWYRWPIALNDEHIDLLEIHPLLCLRIRCLKWQVMLDLLLMGINWDHPHHSKYVFGEPSLFMWHSPDSEPVRGPYGIWPG